MTINLDTEVVASLYDSASGDCVYTIARNGKRWTTKVHEDEFHRIGLGQATLQQRRERLARALDEAMRGPPDPEAPIAAEAPPARVPPVMDVPATVQWKPAWFFAASEAAVTRGLTLAEDAKGYLCFVIDGGLWPISFEGLDRETASADDVAARIHAALPES